MELWNVIKITNALSIDKRNRLIILEKEELGPEDKLIIEFSKLLHSHDIKYAVVAGYVSILFGRNRRTDDIDVVVEEISLEKFRTLCRDAFRKSFEALQADISREESIEKLYTKYFLANYKPRFVKKDMLLPSIEFKKASTALEKHVLDNFYIVIIDGKGSVRISPLELQIAYKLWLGSDKDLGDARFLYKLFRNFLDIGELKEWCEKLKVDLKWLE